MKVLRMPSAERARLATTRPWIASLPKGCVEGLARHASAIRCDPNETVAESSATPSGFFLLMDGSLVVSRERAVETTDPRPLLALTANTREFQAGPEGALLLYLPRHSFLELVDDFPEWTVQLAELAP